MVDFRVVGMAVSIQTPVEPTGEELDEKHHEDGHKGDAFGPRVASDG